MTLRRTTQGNRRFLVSELPHLALLRTAFNVLAFRMSNVAFSVVVGLLLVLGAYGRTIGNLPADSPYARPRPLVIEPPDLPATPEDVAAEAAMRDPEIAVVQHCATQEQQLRVKAMSAVHSRAERRRVGLQDDAPASSSSLTSDPTVALGPCCVRHSAATDPRHHLGPALRSPVHRPGPGLLRLPHQLRTQFSKPRPRTTGSRLHRDPQLRRLRIFGSDDFRATLRRQPSPEGDCTDLS
jgi:hypothetical protein